MNIVRMQTRNGNITLDIAEIMALIARIEEEYVARTKRNNLGSASEHVYRDLANDFKSKFQELKISIYCENHRKGTNEHLETPGYGFLKDLFYTNKSNPKSTYKFCYIDLCYVYAFGSLRDSYLKHKSASTNSSQSVIFSNISITVFLGRRDLTVGKKVKAHIETTFSSSVTLSVPDLATFSKDTLLGLFQSLAPNSILLMIFSASCFKSTEWLVEIVNIRKVTSDQFLRQTLVIGLDDISAGEYDISQPANRYEFVNYWEDQIERLAKTAARAKAGIDGDPIRSQIALEIARIDGFKDEIIPIMDSLCLQNQNYWPLQNFLSDCEPDFFVRYLGGS